MKEIFEAIKPANEFLHPYIDYYYFHQSGDVSNAIKFSYFPHFKHALTVYENSEVRMINSFTSECIPSGSTDYCFNYTNLVSHVARAEIRPPFNKIGVVFNSLGLNHFLKSSLQSTFPNVFNMHIGEFIPNMKLNFKKIFRENEESQRVKLLDQFFQENFQELSDERIKQALDEIHGRDFNFSVIDLAEELDMSRRTLLRLFNRHLNCSPSDYLRLVKFRKAIDLFETLEVKSTLTKLAFEIDYNDQSEFIHHFKKLTGFSPRKFFKNVGDFSDYSTFWLKE